MKKERYTHHQIYADRVMSLPRPLTVGVSVKEVPSKVIGYVGRLLQVTEDTLEFDGLSLHKEVLHSLYFVTYTYLG